MENCLFCKIIRGEIPSVKIYENDKVFAFEDINPLTDGHTLIIPKQHAENLYELDEASLEAIHKASKKIAMAMKTGLNAAGVALLQLNGKAVNQVIMHYHLHLLPRKEDGPEISLTNWEMIPGDMDRIKEIAATLKQAID